MKTYVATVQIVIDPEEHIQSEAEAADYFFALLTEHGNVFDWGYLKLNGQYLYATERILPDNYEEGDFLK